MGFKMKGFPMQAGTSPMRQDEVVEETSATNTATSTADTDIATAQEAERARLKAKRQQDLATEAAEKEKNEANIIAMQDKTGNTLGETNTTNTAVIKPVESGTDVTDETKKQALRDAWRNTGGGHIYAAGESIVKGIKNMRAKRKARKAGELTDAQTAVDGGTANLKQTKLVDKANDKTTRATAKATKDKAKDDAKLVKYNAKKAKKYNAKMEGIKKENPNSTKHAFTKNRTFGGGLSLKK